MTAGYTWEEIRAQLAAYIPPGETLELRVFGGSTVLYWGMQDRLTNDVDVLQSMSSPGLLEVAAAAGGTIRFGMRMILNRKNLTSTLRHLKPIPTCRGSRFLSKLK